MTPTPAPLIVIHETTEEGLPDVIEGMNQSTREWTARAARGECAWVCSDCCYTFNDGMPDKCEHGLQQCTDIILRDKGQAMGYPDEQ